MLVVIVGLILGCFLEKCPVVVLVDLVGVISSV